jgi:hypothetical protein
MMMQTPSLARTAVVILWLLACSGRVQKDTGPGTGGFGTGGSTNGSKGGASGNAGSAGQSAGAHTVGGGGAQNPTSDVRTELCQRLDRCSSRQGMITVDQCRNALAKDDEVLLQRCADCLLAIADDCPPDDICEGSCPAHGF